MVVVDTNVLAYLLIEGDRTDDAQALLKCDPDWRSEEFLMIEFSNVLATYQRKGALSAATARNLLTAAPQFVSLVSTPHDIALVVAAEFNVSAYDARFLAVARQLGAPLITEDLRLRTAAPALTASLAQVLGA